MNDGSRRMIFPSFPPEYRASCVVLHVPSLPSPYVLAMWTGCGGGKSA
jgi:hypothetical protein